MQKLSRHGSRTLVNSKVKHHNQEECDLSGFGYGSVVGGLSLAEFGTRIESDRQFM